MDIIRVPDRLGTLLRSARLQRGLTQSEIAAQLGISKQAVSKLENNAGRAAFERVHRLCLLLGLEIVLRPKGSGQSSTTRSDW